MRSKELIALFEGEKDFFSGLDDLKELVLYGSALLEDELAQDVDLLVIPARELSGIASVELRQRIWEHLKDRLPVALDVQAERPDLDKASLASAGVRATSVFSR